MAPALFDTTTADFKLKAASGTTYLFRATGSIMVFDGFTRLYTEAREEGDHRTLDDEPPLPELAERDRCTLLKITPAQHFTQPPPRFTEASLVKELERLGIGRPSTYAQIISTLTDREYVKLEQKRFQPTPLGETVAKLLVNVFPDVFSVDFTSSMEAELDRVEEGELDWRRVLQDFYGPFQRRLARGVDRSSEIVRATVARDAGPCPRCGREIAVRWNRYGPFLGCTGYPACRHTQPLEEDRKAEPKPTGDTCPKCGAALVERAGRFGPFIACSNYPECKHTQPRTIPGLACPGCRQGQVGEKRTRRGKPFWGCTRYPDCDWSAWDEPVARNCPNCHATLLVRRSSKARGEYLSCLTCAHQYTMGADGGLDPAAGGTGTRRPKRSTGTKAAATHSATRAATHAAAGKAAGTRPAAKRKSAAAKPAAKRTRATAKQDGAKAESAGAEPAEKRAGARTAGKRPAARP
jgi:DNA topoisomerase-1